ncbi:MAG: MATE family efflux transporter, partial [Planctomycetes bacterium]|nr:MATE family efflux transporter [Planctomycetota bacterium]
PDSIVKAHHDMRSTMWAGIASSVLNVVLNAVFVFVFGWGVFGIAFATVLGRLGGLVYAVRVANRHEARRRAEAVGGDDSLVPEPVKSLLTLAIPSGLSFALMALEGIAVNKILAGQPDSTSNLAAFALIDRAGRSLSMPIIALGVAMLPLSARLWGAGDVRGIRRELNTGLRLAVVYGVLIVLPLALLGAPAFARELTELESAESLVRLGLRWLPVGVILGSPMFLLRTTFEGMQKPLPGLAGSAVRAVLLSVPLGFAGLILAPRVGLAPIEGLVLGMSAGSGLASIGMWIWIRAWFGRCEG